MLGENAIGQTRGDMERMSAERADTRRYRAIGRGMLVAGGQYVETKKEEARCIH